MGECKSKQMKQSSDKHDYDDLQANQFCKILLVGGSASGKSTILRATKYMDDDVVNENLSKEAISAIRRLCVTTLMALFQKASYNINIPLNIKDDYVLLLKYQNHSFEGVYDWNEVQILGQSMKRLLEWQRIQTIICKQASYFMEDNIEYFMNNVVDIMQHSYKPTKYEYLSIRLKRNDIDIYRWKSNDIWYELKEFVEDALSLKKEEWIKQFENLSFMINMVAMDNYYKDNGLRLNKDLSLFHQQCNNPMFVNMKICLVFSKMDLFRKSLKVTPFTVWANDHDEYKGKNFNDINDSVLVLLNNTNILPKILKLMDIEDVNIPHGCMNVIGMYFGFEESWLELCVNDAIKFTKQKFISIITSNTDRISVHTVCSLIPQQVNTLFHDITGSTIS